MTRDEIREMLVEIRHYLTQGNPIWDTDKVCEAMTEAIDAFDAHPAKCLNCKYSRVEGGTRWCALLHIAIRDSDSCSYGERMVKNVRVSQDRDLI